ncbi:MAG: putative histidine kinase, classic, partial [Ramlibacter sp.]|jgi:two-component system CheB/CheR fusion protein|nr:putative histidine kinase, classic [Ramlibacter sp.]
VLLNLLANAIKYTPAGGRIWCKATQEGRDIVVRVEDTGMGIDPAMLPRIFDLFARAPRAEEVAPEGLGIGLSIAHQIMKLHGGSLSARSSGAGKGAEFTVRLPAASDLGGEG